MTIRSRFAAVALLGLVAWETGCSGGALPLGLTPTPSPAAAQASTATFTLSGTVSEFTAGGLVALEGALIQAGVCPSTGILKLAEVLTDREGRYSVPGMCLGSTFMWVFKAGYGSRDTGTPLPQCEGADCYIFTIQGDTHYDVELVQL